MAQEECAIYTTGALKDVHGVPDLPAVPQTFLGCLLELFNEATNLGREVPPGGG